MEDSDRASSGNRSPVRYSRLVLKREARDGNSGSA